MLEHTLFSLHFMLSSVQRELPVQPDVMGGVCAAAACGDVERGPVFHSLEHRDSGGCASAGAGRQRTDRMSVWDLHEQEPGIRALRVYFKHQKHQTIAFKRV